jgi:hypothetical protein
MSGPPDNPRRATLAFRLAAAVYALWLLTLATVAVLHRIN